ncbi:MAG: aminoacyl-tRNA hydrolase [Sulfurimonas sp.]|jgi:PTH1 family peptidyl-tRNA hydrolase|nr:aminoacyl-tRNA hydrolase [Sulfurimonadaceae bacterium]
MLLVGLGNPGAKYKNTRHNIGFMVVDEFVKKHNALKINSPTNGELFKYKNHYLLKPLTFMNLSGEAIGSVKNYFKVEDIIIIHDDLDLPFGSLRFKKGGGHGGHNGLKSADLHISSEYIRVRMGIGKPEHKSEVSSYVLSDFSLDEKQKLDEWIEKAVDSLEALLNTPLEKVSSLYTIK